MWISKENLLRIKQESRSEGFDKGWKARKNQDLVNEQAHVNLHNEFREMPGMPPPDPNRESIELLTEILGKEFIKGNLGLSGLDAGYVSSFLYRVAECVVNNMDIKISFKRIDLD